MQLYTLESRRLQKKALMYKQNLNHPKIARGLKL